VKTALERVSVKEVGQGQERHPLVMGHVCLDNHPAFEGLFPGNTLGLPAEIHGLVIAVIPQQSQTGQPFQVLHRFAWCHVQCQQGSVRSDHQLLFQPALQPQSRHTEGLVLIGLFQVKIGKG